MTEQELALRYAPIVHFDQNETIPLQAVGYTIAKETTRSQSFPKREIVVPQDAAFVIEYAYYWDYDIQHMYDLEHIWVTVSGDGQVMDAEGSFHGKYLKLLLPELPGALLPAQGHVHAFCQPGKHAFMPNGQLFRLGTLPAPRPAVDRCSLGDALTACTSQRRRRTRAPYGICGRTCPSSPPFTLLKRPRTSGYRHATCLGQSCMQRYLNGSAGSATGS